jgi:hypothetical protein
MSSSYDAVVLDTAMIEDERLLGLPRGVRLLHWEAMVWAKLHRTDGRIPAGALPRLTDEPEPWKTAEQLVAAGVWRMTDSGWLIAVFLDTQMSAERVREIQEGNRKRFVKWKGHQRVSNASANDPTDRPTARLTEKSEAEGGGGGGAAGLGEPAADAFTQIRTRDERIATALEVVQDPNAFGPSLKAARRELEVLGYEQEAA